MREGNKKKVQGHASGIVDWKKNEKASLDRILLNQKDNFDTW
jgi:hypothetical protein